MNVRHTAIILTVWLCALIATPRPSLGQSLQFSGYSWMVRNDTGGPGPNTFLSRNVSVDSSGALHLLIDKVDEDWTCAELYTTQKFGYGTYEFTVESRVDHLDPNVVLGLFNYPDNAVDGTNEMDIEYSSWGIAGGPNLEFTAYPDVKHEQQVNHSFITHFLHPATLNRFVWSPGSIAFECTTDSGKSVPSVFAHWKTPPSFSKLVSHIPMPVHINLWLFQSPSPSDGQPIEVVIKRFSFTPAQ